MPILGSTGGASVRAFLPVSFKRRLPGWSYGKKIVIPNQQVDANLTNFPVTVYLDSTNFDFSKAKTDGSDIRFTDKDYNHLKFERKEHAGGALPTYGTGSNNNTSNAYSNLVYIGSSATSPATSQPAYKSGNWWNGTSSSVLGYAGGNMLGVYGATRINQINNVDRQYVYAGTNSYTFATPAYAGEWVSVGMAAGGLTTGVYLGNFSIIYNGSVYSISQAITNGYIEPLVLTASGSDAGPYYFPNFHNILTGYTSSGDFPNGFVLFKAKVTITGVNFYSSVQFNTTYDGLHVFKIASSKFEASLSAFNLNPMAVYNVLLPTVSDTVDTEFYMWYGNSAAYNTSIEAWQDQTGKQLTYNGDVKIKRGDGTSNTIAYLYDSGNEKTALTGGWVTGYSAGSTGSQSKESTYMQMYAYCDGVTIGERTYVTSNKINLSSAKKVYMEVEGISGTGGSMISSYLMIHNSQQTRFESGEVTARITGSPYAKTVISADVSNLSGEFYIKAKAWAEYLSGYNITIRVTKIWIEYEKGAKFDGSGDALYTPHNNSFDLSTNDFTIECALTLTGGVNNQNILRDSAGGKLALYVNNTNNIVLYLSTASGTWDIASNFYIGSFANGTKFDVAITRSGSTFRVFFNGNLVNSFTNASAISSFNGFYMGAEFASGSITYSMNGYMHGLRITNGRARYTSSYTPPTSFVIDGTDVVFNTNFDTVYDSNYVMVHHMGTSLVDASGNGNNATNYNTTNVSTQFGTARYFNRSTTYLTVPHNADTSLSSGEQSTVLVLLKPDIVDATMQGIYVKDNSWNHGLWFHNTTIRYHRNDSGTMYYYDWTPTFVANQYKSIVFRTTALNDQKYTADGINYPPGALTTTTSAVGSNPLYIGAFYDQTYKFSGMMNAFRMSNIARSDAWIELESKVLKNNVLEFADVDDSLTLYKEYELLADITVGTATTSIDITGLDISPEDELLLVSEVVNATSISGDTLLMVNNNTTITNYYTQVFVANSSSLAAARENRPYFGFTEANSRGAFITKIKITNNGYFVYQSDISRYVGTNNVFYTNEYGTSTFTISSISTLNISHNTANGIGAGSRFQLYKINGTAVV